MPSGEHWRQCLACTVVYGDVIERNESTSSIQKFVWVVFGRQKLGRSPIIGLYNRLFLYHIWNCRPQHHRKFSKRVLSICLKDSTACSVHISKAEKKFNGNQHILWIVPVAFHFHDTSTTRPIWTWTQYLSWCSKETVQLPTWNSWKMLSFRPCPRSD